MSPSRHTNWSFPFEPLVDRVLAFDWSFDLDALRRSAAAAGLHATSAVSGRASFEDSAGCNGSAYHDDGRIFAVEITYEFVKAQDGPAEGEFDRQIARLTASFGDQREVLGGRLGSSKFFDDVFAPDYPDGADACLLACWRWKGKTLRLALKNEGYDVPMRLCLIVAP